MRRILYESNDLEGSDFRDEIHGLDLDECLREAVANHFITSKRTRADVALTLRMSEADFSRWYDGHESASLEMVSAICGAANFSIAELFALSPSFREHSEVVADYSTMVAKRIAFRWQESDLHLALALGALIDAVPECELPIHGGIKTAIKFASKCGFDVSRIQAALDRTASEIRSATVGGGVRDYPLTSASSSAIRRISERSTPFFSAKARALARGV